MRRKDEKKRTAIYRAAMEVVNSSGVEKASMAKIARNAGISASTLYVYFSSKADMINKLYLMVKQEMCGAMFKDITGDMEIEAASKSWMRNLFLYLVANPMQLSFLEQFHNSPSISADTEEQARAYFTPLVELHARAINEGRVRDHPAPFYRAFVFDPLMRLARVHVDGELRIDEHLLDTALNMAWGAIRK